MRLKYALLLPISVGVTAVLLAGCMQTTPPAATEPRNDLDSGGRSQAAPASSALADSAGGISAVRTSFAASPHGARAAATPVAYTTAPASTPVAPHRLDAGDRLRVVVYGQDGLTNTYAIDGGGSITMPLIGAVSARGKTPARLAADIAARLRNGYIRDPSVAVEVETYRPFFILGEVQAPGQYPYVPNMSVESAVATAGGFSPRAKRDSVTLTHNDASGAHRAIVAPGSPINPGDTILVSEREF